MERERAEGVNRETNSRHVHTYAHDYVQYMCTKYMPIIAEEEPACTVAASVRGNRKIHMS